jgi:formylglycine-generating enzyme required for sulfatase activity
MPPRLVSLGLAAFGIVGLAACRAVPDDIAPPKPEPVATPPVAASSASSSPSPAPPSCPEGRLFVPAGAFRMGSEVSDPDADPDERPTRDEHLHAYCLDRTEVTVTSYTRCVEAGGCTPASRTVVSRGLAPDDVRFWSKFCNAGVEGHGEHPVNCVDWKQARAYCHWAGGRLPTEAEWERAARGSDGRTYPWGNEAPSAMRLNACGAECGAKATALGVRAKVTLYDGGDGAESTAPVGSYPDGASPFGILDMAGNVWEWTADGYAPYDSALTEDPTHETGPLRVVRGGHWLSALARTVRAANRDPRHEDKRLEDVGFRCASTP